VAVGPALALLALGVGGTGPAYVLYWRVMEIAGATVDRERHVRDPWVSTALGVLVLHEGVRWYEPVGGVVVLAGVALTQWGAVRRSRPRCADLAHDGGLVRRAKRAVAPH